MKGAVMRLKLVLSLIVILSVIVCLPKSAFSDDYQSRLSAAKRYAKITPMSKMYDDALENIAKRLPEDERDNFLSNIKTFIDIEKTEKMAIDTMAKHFTVNELNALADFYGSPVGKSIMGKFGPYMADIQMELIKQVSLAIKKYKKVHNTKN